MDDSKLIDLYVKCIKANCTSTRGTKDFKQDNGDHTVVAVDGILKLYVPYGCDHCDEEVYSRKFKYYIECQNKKDNDKAYLFDFGDGDKMIFTSGKIYRFYDEGDVEFYCDFPHPVHRDAMVIDRYGKYKFFADYGEERTDIALTDVYKWMDLTPEPDRMYVFEVVYENVKDDITLFQFKNVTFDSVYDTVIMLAEIKYEDNMYAKLESSTTKGELLSGDWQFIFDDYTVRTNKNMMMVFNPSINFTYYYHPYTKAEYIKVGDSYILYVDLCNGKKMIFDGPHIYRFNQAQDVKFYNHYVPVVTYSYEYQFFINYEGKEHDVKTLYINNEEIAQCYQVNTKTYVYAFYGQTLKVKELDREMMNKIGMKNIPLGAC